MKELFIREYWNIDFCSKWGFSRGSVSDWSLYRDLSKTAAKLHYSKRNAELLSAPRLYAQALLDGLRTEKVSKLLEDIFEYRV